MKGKGMKKNSGDRIGLDFGTTYSVISQIKVDSNGHIGVEACKLNEGGASSEILDSIVLKDRNGELLFGTSARNKVGRSGFDTYTGFKMMLSETDENVLKQRFYDDKFTPRYIVSEYLDYLLNLYRNRTGKEDKEKILKAFETALTDLCKGYLPLGGGVNRGNGTFKGSLKKNGETIYE